MNATRKQLLVTGIIQLIIGSFCLIFGVFESISANGFQTITSNVALGAWMGFWIATTGLLGILTKVSTSLKPMTAVYLGFTITSIVLAAAMIVCYSLTVGITYNLWDRYKSSPTYPVSVLILVFGVLEFGIGIWASFCCGRALGCSRCCRTTSSLALTVERIEQIIYKQLQAGGPPIEHIFIQGPDGNPVEVPAIPTIGPVIEQNGIPPPSNTVVATHQGLQTRKTETETRGHSCHTESYV